MTAEVTLQSNDVNMKTAAQMHKYDVCTSVFEFSAPFAHVLYDHTLFSVDFTLLGMNVHRRSVFCTQKKPITERNSHLAGEASGSSISNGCQAKTERRRQLAGVGTWRGVTKLHASVAGSRVTAFLATAASWEPYFTDNPRILDNKTTVHGI
jgi:hypothetical protein